MRAALLIAAGLAAAPLSAADAPAEGQRIFARVCSACHANDLSEAPQLKQPAMWTARIAKGRDTLLAHALNGFVGPSGEEMPPRGGRPELTDAEVSAALDYIIATVNPSRTTP